MKIKAMAGCLALALGAAAWAGDQDVRRCGAVGDGKTLDTAAVQAAIDAAAGSGGGLVRVPPGHYLIAGIALKSKVTLQLDKGAVLLGSREKKDYADGGGTIVSALEAEQIAIVGEGAIDGQARGDFGARWGAPGKLAFRTHPVRLDKCRDVKITGVKLLYGDMWTLQLFRCEKVLIDGIEILANYRRLNSDGIDPDCCKDVIIRNCHIVTGDDAIVLKSTAAYPCENIEVSNCVLESATAALKIGTSSEGDFRNIRFRDCKIVNSPVGVGVFIKDGATLEDFTNERIEMDLCGPEHHAVIPLFIDIEPRHKDSKIGRVRNVTFSDIKITGGAGLLMQGMPQSLLESITLRNIRMTVKQPQDYAKRRKPVGGQRTTSDERDTKYARMETWAALANIKGLVVDGFRVNAGESFKPWPRSAMALFNVENATLRDVAREPAAGRPATVEMTDCKNVAK